jgi:hypothetical protein
MDWVDAVTDNGVHGCRGFICWLSRWRPVSMGTGIRALMVETGRRWPTVRSEDLPIQQMVVRQRSARRSHRAAPMLGQKPVSSRPYLFVTSPAKQPVLGN